MGIPARFHRVLDADQIKQFASDEFRDFSKRRWIQVEAGIGWSKNHAASERTL